MLHVLHGEVAARCFPFSTHLALHHAELLTQVTVELEELLYLGLRGVQGTLHLHEFLHRDWSVGEVR